MMKFNCSFQVVSKVIRQVFEKKAANQDHPPKPGDAKQFLYSYFQRLAGKAKEGASEDEDQVLVAIVFSVLFLEVFLNELPEFVKFRPEGMSWDKKLSCLAKMFDKNKNEKCSIEEKLSVIVKALNCNSLKKGERPWQDLKQLVGIRHKIVHRKADIFSLGSEISELRLCKEDEKILRFLRDRGIITSEVRGPLATHLLLNKKESYEIAKWAYRTVTEIFDLISECLPEPVKSLVKQDFQNAEN